MCICQLVSRHMNIKKAIRLECKRAKRKRTEANPESKNKRAICVRSLQPLSRALGALVSFPHSRSLLLCCYSLTLQVIQCLLAHTRADTRNRSLWNQQFAMASQEFHERQCSAFVLFFFFQLEDAQKWDRRLQKENPGIMTHKEYRKKSAFSFYLCCAALL